MGDVFELRPKGGDTEKITINLGYVDLGHIDLMVHEGFYSNRTDFIRTAIQNQLDRHNDAAVEAFREAILRAPEVVACHMMTGAFDYLLSVVAPDLDAYAEFTIRRLLKLPGVKDVRSSFVLDTLKDSTALPLDQVATD